MWRDEGLCSAPEVVLAVDRLKHLLAEVCARHASLASGIKVVVCSGFEPQCCAHGGSVLAAQFTGVFRYGALIEVLPEDGS